MYLYHGVNSVLRCHNMGTSPKFSPRTQQVEYVNLHPNPPTPTVGGGFKSKPKPPTHSPRATYPSPVRAQQA